MIQATIERLDDLLGRVVSASFSLVQAAMIEPQDFTVLAFRGLPVSFSLQAFQGKDTADQAIAIKTTIKTATQAAETTAPF